MRFVMPGTVRIVIGLLVVCLAGAVVTSDEPQLKREAPPEAKKAEAKPAEAKKADEEGEKKKAKAPAGYEDAPIAGNRAQVRRVVAPAIAVEALDIEDVEAVGEDFARVLAAKVDGNVLNLAQQALPQFTRLMTAELSFINRTCDLNLEQRKKIKAASDTCLKAAVRHYAMGQRGMMVGWEGRAQPTLPDPNELVHQALAKVLKETLRPEQQSAYDSEIAKREAFRRRVAIDNIVAILDERLILTIEQRRQLTESLDKNWQPGWVQSIEMLMNSNQYLPSIPDQFVAPALNEEQRQVWRAARKRIISFGMSHWGEQAAVLDDFPLVEAEAVVER